MNQKRIYLDANATTALDPRVLKAMLLELEGPPANPSSVHAFGQRAKGLLAGAREKVALFLGAKPEELIFTSGGTESINTFLRGIQGHIISTEIEHPSIFQTLKELQKTPLTFVPVGLWGAPLVEEVEQAIRPDTGAIVLSASNAETGVKLDGLEKMAHLAKTRGIPLLIDATSYIGKESWTLYPGISAVALSGHKFHGPKGVGLLYLRAPLTLNARMTGGAQENGRRAGTENLAGILGLAEAMRILMDEQPQITKHLLALRTRLEEGLMREISGLEINGLGPRVANTTNFYFPDIDGETLLMQLDLANVAVSHGTACSSGNLEPSRVLTAMGFSQKRARSSIRFSLSKMNTFEEIDLAIEKTAQIVKLSRKMAHQLH